jgi:hypothetical protein
MDEILSSLIFFLHFITPLNAFTDYTNYVKYLDLLLPKADLTLMEKRKGLE